MKIPPRYRRAVPERDMKRVVPNGLLTERLGKMPMMPRMPRVPFGETRQTLPVLLDRRGWPDDFQVEVTVCPGS